MELNEMQEEIERLTNLNKELFAFKQEFSSAKQSFSRMGARLKKLCKRLDPTNETVVEMQKLASEIKEMTRDI